MPKRPATEIIEHRIGLTGSMNDIAKNVNDIAKRANMITGAGVVVAGVGVAGVGYLAYNLAKYFGGKNPITDLKDSMFDTLDKFFIPNSPYVDDIFNKRQQNLTNEYDKMVAYYQSIIESDFATDAQKDVARENLLLANRKYKEKTAYNNEQRQRVSSAVESMPVGGPLGSFYRGVKYIFD